jgi:hypothetical protein
MFVVAQGILFISALELCRSGMFETIQTLVRTRSQHAVPPGLKKEKGEGGGCATNIPLLRS